MTLLVSTFLKFNYFSRKQIVEATNYLNALHQAFISHQECLQCFINAEYKMIIGVTNYLNASHQALISQQKNICFLIFDSSNVSVQ